MDYENTTPKVNNQTIFTDQNTGGVFHYAHPEVFVTAIPDRSDDEPELEDPDSTCAICLHGHGTGE